MSMVRLRIINLKQFPLPGARVWRDTPIVRSGKARLDGWVLGYGVLIFSWLRSTCRIPSL